MYFSINNSFQSSITNLGISNELDIWENIQLPIISCGLLSIKNIEIKAKYIYVNPVEDTDAQKRYLIFLLCSLHNRKIYNQYKNRKI